MNAREELERIIDINDFTTELEHGTIAERHKRIAQAILDAGFIRLEDVEIDEDKLGIKLYLKSPMRLSPETARRIANAICQEKGILRVKEGK